MDTPPRWGMTNSVEFVERMDTSFSFDFAVLNYRDRLHQKGSGEKLFNELWQGKSSAVNIGIVVFGFAFMVLGALFAEVF